jgi:hypothetical protein
VRKTASRFTGEKNRLQTITENLLGEGNRLQTTTENIFYKESRSRKLMSIH